MALKVGNTNSNVAVGPKWFKGDPGGYYTPTVSEDGNLTWSPSGDDMPQVEASNIKGPAGEAGAPGKNTVYIGEEEPSEEYSVWIAPGGVPTYVMTAEQVQAYIDAALKEVEDGSY